MTDIQKTIISYSVETETKSKIEDLCRLTKRSQGNVIDWLVSEAYDRIQKVARENTTMEEAMLSQDGG